MAKWFNNQTPILHKTVTI